MQHRQPRSEINKKALIELDIKISVAKETGRLEDAKYAKGILRGLELAELFRGASGAAAVKKLYTEIDGLIAAHSSDH